MNKKGFTLVELLGVIVLIAILAGLAVISVSNIINSGKKGLYKNYENTLKSATMNYFLDHPDSVPHYDTPVIIQKIRLTYKDLLDGHYIEELHDPNGGNCEDSYVEVSRYKNIGNNMDLNYKTCVICKINDDKYTYLDDDCSDSTSFYINATGTEQGSVTYNFSNLVSQKGKVSIVVLNADGSIKSSKSFDSGSSATVTIKNNEKITISNLKKCIFLDYTESVKCPSQSWCDDNGICYNTFLGTNHSVYPSGKTCGIKNTIRSINFDQLCK